MFQLVMLVGISICDKGILVYWMYSTTTGMEVQWKYNSIKSNNMHFDYNLHLE